MSPKPFFGPNRRRRTARYGRDVRAWSTGILVRYVRAVSLLLAALAGLIGAIAVGLGALFHFLELKYGTWTAYGSIAGLLIGLTIVAAALGVAKLKQDVSAPPSPQRHAKAASRIVVAESMGALAGSGRAMAARPVLPAAIGLASVGLLGWLIASRRGASRARAIEPE